MRDIRKFIRIPRNTMEGVTTGTVKNLVDNAILFSCDFMWKVTNKEIKQNNWEIFSPILKTWFDTEWQIFVFTDVLNKDIYITVYLIPSTETITNKENFKAECQIKYKNSYLFSKRNNASVEHNVALKPDEKMKRLYYGHENHFVPNLIPKLQAIETKELTFEIKFFIKVESACNYSPPVLVKAIGDNRNEYFSYLWEDKILTDFHIIVGDKVFKTHRLVLAACSPVFKSMFQNEFRENYSREMNITDFDEKTIYNFLKYIYTKSTPNFDITEAKNLYRVSDKYDVSDLKLLCKKFLMHKIIESARSIQNENAFYDFTDCFQVDTWKDTEKLKKHQNLAQINEISDSSLTGELSESSLTDELSESSLTFELSESSLTFELSESSLTVELSESSLTVEKEQQDLKNSVVKCQQPSINPEKLGLLNIRKKITDFFRFRR